MPLFYYLFEELIHYHLRLLFSEGEGFVKNNKAIVVISRIMSAAAILCAVLISLGGTGMSKNVIVTLGIAVGWFIIGIINWKKGGKTER